jgi:hypothetical protein
MLLRVLKANRFSNLLLVPFVGGLLLLTSLLMPQAESGLNTSLISPFIDPLLQVNHRGNLSVFLAWTAALVVCFFLTHLNARFAIVRERTYLQSFVYLVLVLSFSQVHLIQPVYFAAIFVMLAIRSLWSALDEKSAATSIFEAAMFIALASFFYPYALVLVVLAPISLFVLQNKMGWREFFATLWGLFIPWAIISVSYYLLGVSDLLVEVVLGLFKPQQPLFYEHLPNLVYYAFFLLMVLIPSFFLIRQYNALKISTRRYYKVLFFFFILSFSMIFIPGVSSEIMVIIAIPVSFLFTNFLLFSKKRFWTELFFIVLVLASLAMQLFN